MIFKHSQGYTQGLRQIFFDLDESGGSCLNRPSGVAGPGVSGLVSAATATEASTVTIAKTTASASAVAGTAASTAPSTRTRLSSQDCSFASLGAAAATPGGQILQHRRVLQHVRQNHKPDFGSTDIDVFQLSYAPVPVGDGDAGHLGVHVILRLDKLSTVHLSSGGFHGDAGHLGVHVILRLDK